MSIVSEWELKEWSTVERASEDIPVKHRQKNGGSSKGGVGGNTMPGPVVGK
jgi:hypothetical protein